MGYSVGVGYRGLRIDAYNEHASRPSPLPPTKETAALRHSNVSPFGIRPARGSTHGLSSPRLSLLGYLMFAIIPSEALYNLQPRSVNQGMIPVPCSSTHLPSLWPCRSPGPTPFPCSGALFRGLQVLLETGATPARSKDPQPTNVTFGYIASPDLLLSL